MPLRNVIPMKKGSELDERLTTQGAYPSDDDLAFVKKVESWWKDSDEASANWLTDEKRDHEFVMGHQWDAQDYDLIKKTGRYPLTLNKSLPMIQVVSGHERGNRMRVRYLPVESGDSQKAEDLTEVARIVQERGDVDFNKSEAFFTMLKGGRGFILLRPDFTDNPAGEVMSDSIFPWDVRIDPEAPPYDYFYNGKARYVILSKEVTLEDLLLLWPEKGEELKAAQALAVGGEQNFMPMGDRDSDYDSIISTNYDKNKKRWKLKEAWYWQVEKTSEYLFFNPQSLQWQELEDKESLLKLLMAMPDLQWRHDPRYERKYYQAFTCGPVLLQNEPSYLKEYKGFPLVPVYGLWDTKTGRYVAMTSALRDPQIEMNKRRTQVLHIINRAAKSGWIAPRGSLVDRDRWEKKSAWPGFVGEYDVNISGGQKPEQIKPEVIPAAFVQLEQMAAVDLRDVSGVNIELMGLSTKDTPGVVTNQRQRQAMTILQVYFDSLRRSTKVLGRLILAFIREFMTDGRMFEIRGNMMALGSAHSIGRYDLIAEEAPWSPNQKTETALKLQGVIEIASKIGAPIPPDVIKYLDLPESLTEKWKEMLEMAMGMGGAFGLPSGLPGPGGGGIVQGPAPPVGGGMPSPRPPVRRR